MNDIYYYYREKDYVYKYSDRQQESTKYYWKLQYEKLRTRYTPEHIGVVRPVWGNRWQAKAHTSGWSSYYKMMALGKFATKEEAQQAIEQAIRAIK